VRLYHFTCHLHLRAILAAGLSRGEVPITPDTLENAVWLTSDRSPAGHGLSDGAPLDSAMLRSLGRSPGTCIRTQNKRAIRISVDIAYDDPRLEKWERGPTRKRLPRHWRRTLEGRDAAMGRSGADTWFLYWGTIAPDRFVEVEALRDAAPHELALMDQRSHVT